MQLQDFKLERYFAKYEFSVDHLLSASDCESLTLEELLALADPQGLELWQNLRLGYTESNGHPLLRQEIAKLYPSLSPDNCLVAAPEEAIFVALNALLEPGDHVITIDPAYQSLQEIPRSLGCRVTPWTLTVRDGAWNLDLDSLEQEISPAAKLLIVNFPHNPTGFLPGQEDYLRLIDLARRHGLYLFSDEMYWLLEYDPGDRLPPAAEVYEKGISLFGLSKTFGLPGLRIGWLATPDRKLLRQAAALKDYTTICSSAPSEVLAIIALRAREEIVRRSLELIGHNLQAAQSLLAKYPRLFQWLAPQAGPLCFPGLAAQVPVAEFCAEVVQKQNLMILPGSVFDFSGNHFRIGLGRRDLPLALARLDDYLQSRFGQGAF